MAGANGRPSGALFGGRDLVYPASDVYGWRDILGQAIVRGVGANDPTWSQIGAGPLRAFNFAVNDEVWISYHFPHDYVPQSDIHLHAHWFADGTDGNAVRWEWSYAFARGFNRGNFDPDADGTITAENSPGASAYRHIVSETAAIEDANFEVDGLLYCRLRRVTNGAVDNADNVFLLQADVHYQSSNEPTPNKAPNFYRAP